MGRAVLQACLPWLALLLVLILAAWALARFSRVRLRLGRLFELHRDEVGTVQSLSFVLTLPAFIMILMMIVQVSQLMIGTIVVHYAAFAAARSAAVWIPAAVSDLEGPDCISAYSIDPEAKDQVFPVIDPEASGYGPANGGLTYLIDPSGQKYEKIAAAAILACMPISPSRDVGATMPASATQMATVLKAAYGALSPSSNSNGAVPRRLDNKLAYAMNNTQVEVRFFHKNQEPPLMTYYEWDDPAEFYFNEVGWQDMITVTVKHQFALLPGPGRLLARFAIGPQGGTDEIAETIEKNGKVHVYPLKASASIGNEGEKSAVTYVHR